MLSTVDRGVEKSWLTQEGSLRGFFQYAPNHRWHSVMSEKTYFDSKNNKL